MPQAIAQPHTQLPDSTLTTLMFFSLSMRTEMGRLASGTPDCTTPSSEQPIALMPVNRHSRMASQP